MEHVSLAIKMSNRSLMFATLSLYFRVAMSYVMLIRCVTPHFHYWLWLAVQTEVCMLVVLAMEDKVLVSY